MYKIKIWQNLTTQGYTAVKIDARGKISTVAQLKTIFFYSDENKLYSSLIVGYMYIVCTD